MSDVKRLVASIVQFLGSQISGDVLTSDAKESLEVAIQCLENAYEVSSSDTYLLPSKSLTEIYSEAIKGEPMKEAETAVSDEDKAEAERLKNEGNNLMKQDMYDDALKCYTKAIQLDPKNAVFYCNRAAAYSKLNNHSFALEDCRRAITIDPNYSKAYGRMGLAFASLNDHFQARDCYKKAAELDPQNESYKNNLSIAEEKVADIERQDPLGPFRNMGLGGGPGGFDLGAILNNPALMNMASQLMQDPNMQNLIGGLMAGGAPGAGPAPPPEAEQPVPADAGEGGAPPGGFDAFLRAGQQLAAQMQAANPDLVEQLRQQMGPGTGGAGGGPASGPNKPDDDKSGSA
jgi:small glutamine-rich tetratricopeptide repeat-containing protein alpha